MAKGGGSAGRAGRAGGGGLQSLGNAEFGSAVESAARQAGADFGGDRVFIDRAFAQARSNGDDISLTDFKARLVSANRSGDIRLVRSDLAYALNQRNVRASETKTGASTFHFIRIDR